MKTAFILFYIIASPAGQDQFNTKAFSDLGECEFQRQQLKHEGYVVGDTCLKINYTVNTNQSTEPVK